MIWLASFPRSGNTFLRNVLFEVYGLESSTFHREEGRPLDRDYASYPFVKTHLLPGQLSPDDSEIKAVYLVRDARDALVSISHHREDFVDPNSDFEINLLEAIVAAGGSFFGGWSENVRQWTERADIVIRFEDLIQDPIGQVERLREIMDLPEPRLEKLPSFKQLKSGTPKYGSGRDFLNTEEEMHGIAHKNFRKGKVGSWREEFPETLLPLFWMIHQEEMERWGYTNMEEKTQVREKPIKAIVDAQKLLDPSRDGIRRYVEELILNLWVLESKTGAYWQIDLLIGNDLTFSLKEYVRQNHSLEKVLTLNNEELEALNKELEVLYTYESRLMRIKGMLKERLPRNLYLMLRKAYINLPFRIILSYFRKRKTETIISKETEPPIYDIIHIPLPQRVPEVSIQARKHVTTLHDLTHKLFPQFHEKSNSIKAESGLKDAIKKKSEFICISQATQEDLLTYYPVESNRTHVIYESASRSHFFPRKDDNNWQKILEKYGLADEKFFFCLFTLEPRKNVRGTIEAFRLFKKAHPSEPILLWIGGKTGWKMEGLFEKDALKEEGIFFPGFIDEADLPYFYSKMEALCYISHYEGFGLPPFEAMSCGAPVIYGNNSSMRELIGTAGLPADAGDVEEIKSQMETILFDSELKEELALRSLQQTARFSWLKMAWETLQVYEKTLISGGKT